MRAFNTAAVTKAEGTWTADRVHKAGAVPPTPPTPYMVVAVTSGAPENYRNSGQSGSRKSRIVVQAVGATYDEVAFAVEKADSAFEDKSLTVTGFDCGPCTGDDRVASPVIRDPDAEQFLTCTVIYPFHAFPTT